MVAILVSDRARKFLLGDDPQEIVIDEVAGLLVTFFLLPLSWLSLPLGCVLFRVFDMSKPFPIRRLEKIRGGAGIVLDDILAGVYANLSVRILLFIFL
jgi:phosphatidylglycerophosphatase A